jgi:uncharacterized repeat protein (TIGR03803 family)
MRTLALATITVLLTLVTTLPMQAQTFTVLHAFTGGADGAVPLSGLNMDRAGNLYGTASEGGRSGNCTIANGCGIVYKVTHSGSGSLLTPIYNFQGQNAGVTDGSTPGARVIFGPDGALYGTTAGGGSGCVPGGCGTAFRLTPAPTTCRAIPCLWSETVLYRFQGGNADAAGPSSGDIAFDHAGNLYGTTTGASAEPLCDDSYCGALYELSPANGQWTETYLCQLEFCGPGGFWPYGGLTVDASGNLYGALAGADGMVYKMIPGNDGPSVSLVFDFTGQSQGWPFGGLIFDAAGNLYGSTAAGGFVNGTGGSVFELVRNGSGWNYQVLYTFAYNGDTDVPGPQASLTMDAAGNLYGTTFADGAHGCGTVFKLTPSNGTWTHTSLHAFNCGSDGAYPISNVTFDSAGNLYGTASQGGADGKGVVWEITP